MKNFISDKTSETVNKLGDAVPGDLHSDANHDECGQTKKHAETNLTKNAFESFRRSIANLNTRCDN